MITMQLIMCGVGLFVLVLFVVGISLTYKDDNADT